MATKDGTHYEIQVFWTDDGFAYTVAISRLGHEWVSAPAPLEATTWDTAREEAKSKVVALEAVLGGGGR
jgi:hypothetical protein